MFQCIKLLLSLVIPYEGHSFAYSLYSFKHASILLQVSILCVSFRKRSSLSLDGCRILFIFHILRMEMALVSCLSSNTVFGVGWYVDNGLFRHKTYGRSLLKRIQEEYKGSDCGTRSLCHLSCETS